MHLSEAQIEFILVLIDTWEPEAFGKLTVNNLMYRFEKKYGNKPTDRTLRNHSRIQERIKLKKESLKSGGDIAPAKPSSLEQAGKTITKLKARVEALGQENEHLFHKLVVWQKNALDLGLTQEQLDRALPVNKETLRHIKGEVK